MSVLSTWLLFAFSISQFTGLEEDQPGHVYRRTLKCRWHMRIWSCIGCIVPSPSSSPIIVLTVLKKRKRLLIMIRHSHHMTPSMGLARRRALQATLNTIPVEDVRAVSIQRVMTNPNSVSISDAVLSISNRPSEVDSYSAATNTVIIKLHFGQLLFYIFLRLTTLVASKASVVCDGDRLTSDTNMFGIIQEIEKAHKYLVYFSSQA